MSDLPLCPLCGGDGGYTLTPGDTYRWWIVLCGACGETVTTCGSDRRISNDAPLPNRWHKADTAWTEACEYTTGLRAEIERLRGAMRADDDRLMTAGVRVGIVLGCDTAEAMADEIDRLRAQVETLDWQLAMESIDTTCHCAAKSAADCGCPGAVWPEDVLRAENGRLREALHTAREGLAHIKAVARLHAEGADTALEGRS